MLKLGAGTGLLAGLSGCLRGGGGDGDTVKIGAVYPESGAFSALGEDSFDALEYVKERFENDMSDRSVEIIEEDSATDPNTAAPAANSLVQEENVDALFGGISSAVALALRDIAGREEVLFFSSATSTQITSGVDCNRYTFHNDANSHDNVQALEMGYEEDILNSFFVSFPDYAGARNVYETGRAGLEDLGAEYMGHYAFDLTTTDFSTSIEQARNSGADAVFHIHAGVGDINFLQQADNAGLLDEMDVVLSLPSINTGRTVGSEILAKGVYGYTSSYWNRSSPEGVAEVADAYQEQFDRRPTWQASRVVDEGLEYLFSVEETGGTEADPIIDLLEGREYSWQDREKWRACDHKGQTPMFFTGGKPLSEKDEEEDYFTVMNSMAYEDITQPSCEEKGCQL